MRPLGKVDLPGALIHRGPATENLPTPIDLGVLCEAVDNVFDEDLESTALDVALVEPVHRSLSALTRREAADMRVWHWICVDQFPNVVKHRWEFKSDLASVSDVEAKVMDRFLGNSTLAGVAGNTFARLWWAAEQLGDYEKARLIVSSAEDYVGILERFYGIYEPAAEAALGRFSSRSLKEDDQREAAKWLQQNLATTVLESLDEAQVGAILDESIVPGS